MAPRLTSVFVLCSLLGGSFLSADTVFKPTWETQRLARTYVLNIPAPRGQISDRNGEPLAQTRVSYNLGISFPTPLTFSDAEALGYARQQLAKAESLLGRSFSVEDQVILKHYRNRPALPLDIAEDITSKEQKAIRKSGGDGLVLRGVYLRYYPHGNLAAHILGYIGRTGRPVDTPLQNFDLLWPEVEGREGLELTFNEQLVGKPGQVTINFDAKGEKVSEKVTEAPEAGANVVTTLDLRLQKICEKALAEGVKRGAIVVVDPNNGDILAMASWPTYDPNLFVPWISTKDYNALNEDKDLPLIPRAFRSAYPPGSIFKMISGIASLETGKISTEDRFSGPPSMQIGNVVFHNARKTHAGMLTYTEALEQSCNTWFYQVGIKAGSKPIVEWAQLFGLGEKTGIPLRSEVEGLVPTDDYMRKVHGRKLLDGDIANLSIGQGDLLTSPLQMAEAMAAIANGGTLYKARLVKHVQGNDDKIVLGYDVAPRKELPISEDVLAATRKGMVLATSGGRGTGRRASVSTVQVAGKTGTAEWGPKNNKRYAAWFAGYAPAEEPEYAFAVLYEGERGESRAFGGTVAAPIIGKIMKELYPSKKGKKGAPEPEPETQEGQDEEEILD